MLQTLKRLFTASGQEKDEELQKRLEDLRAKTPVPVFWLFGKTQSGKTSIVKFFNEAEKSALTTRLLGSMREYYGNIVSWTNVSG